MSVLFESLVYGEVVTYSKRFEIFGAMSGRGAVWLARVLWEHEVGGSNPLAPTIILFGEALKTNGGHDRKASVKRLVSGGNVDRIVNVATPLLKAWLSTVRIQIVNEPILERIVRPKSAADQFVVATWHRCAIFFVYLFGPIHPMILFSRSRDGELLARFAEKVGVEVARGSSSRGGTAAIRIMARFLRSTGRHCATVVDGPRGPAFKSKPGLVAVSQITGIPILPIMWSSRNPITFRKTWDGTMIPRPFGKVTIMCGTPFHVPKGGKNVIEDYNQILEDRLNHMKDQVDEMCGYEFPA